MKNDDILSKLINYKTDGDETGINNCLKYVQKILSKFGWKTILLKNNQNGKNNLVAVLNGDLCNINDGLLLAGHIDTVVTDASKWNSNPLKLTCKDSNYYGLGVADMKNFTASVLMNLEEINNLNINKPIVFVLTNDEETIMYSINCVIDYMKQNNIRPRYAIIGEPSNMRIATSNKGFYEFETVINGKAAHSSSPKLGTNAVYMASKLITFIESLTAKYAEFNTTINVGIVNGGTMCNIVPGKCTLRWDVRTFERKNLNNIKAEVNAFLDELVTEYTGASYTNEIVFNIPPFEYQKSEITEGLKESLKTNEFTYSAATEAGFYQELGIDCAIYGCGSIEDCHAINEKINLDDFAKYQKGILKIIASIC